MGSRGGGTETCALQRRAVTLNPCRERVSVPARGPQSALYLQDGSRLLLTAVTVVC